MERTNLLIKLFLVTCIAPLLCSANSNMTMANEGLTMQSAVSDSGATELWQPYYISLRSGNQHLDLAHNWQLGYLDEGVNNLSQLESVDEWISVENPTSVQMAYYKAGKLPDPYEHLNSKDYLWMEEKVWYYRKHFETPEISKDSNFFLSFDGLDYFAKIWVNGQLMGRHEGMFGGPVVEISDEMEIEGENEIVVEIKSGNYGQWETFDWRNPGKIIKPRTLARGSSHKPFFALGMWRGARLDILPANHIARPYLRTQEINPETGDATMFISAELFTGTHTLDYELHPWHETQISNYSDITTAPNDEKISEDLQLKVEFFDEQGVAYSKQFPVYELKGRSWIEEQFEIENPDLWWPNGMGDQNLYNVVLTLLEEGERVDRIEFDYGIRTIERVRSEAPRLSDRRKNWQFKVNGQPLFVKGVNWMPMDPLLNLPEENYDWLIEAAESAGIKMIRIWGGGMLETNDFYDACNKNGILVWQDFPKNNNETPDWPQDVLEAQVVHNIYRLRNQPSLAVWNGGNEFNPYAYGNAETMAVLERSMNDFDPSRVFLRTSPDHGSTHLYPDFDPIWYRNELSLVPFIAEAGIHSVPEAQSLYEIVDRSEFKNLGDMYNEGFAETHPEFLHHFMEYSPYRVPRMLSRASHILNMENPSLEDVSEATQIGAGEFYQIMSEGIQSNYPATTGLMPWVFKRPWPIVAAIHLLDGFGQPSAPYYFLKRTYEDVHVQIDIPRLLWRQSEKVDIKPQVINAEAEDLDDHQIEVQILNENFEELWQDSGTLTIAEGPSISEIDLGSFIIPEDYKNQFFFILVELTNSQSSLVSRQVYWPRTIPQMEEESFYEEYTSDPIEWPTLEDGPWLKPTIGEAPKATLETEIMNQDPGKNRTSLTISIENSSNIPSFMTQINIKDAKRLFYATDNFFWLAPGEVRELEVEIKWRDPDQSKSPVLEISAWNVNPKRFKIELQ